MNKTLGYLWCRIVGIGKYSANVGIMYGERQCQGTSCGDNGIRRRNRENNPSTHTGPYSNSNNFHYIPTSFNNFYGRGVGLPTYYYPPQMMHSAYPSPNYVWNPYSTNMHYHTNYNYPPVVYNYGPMHSYDQYVHRNVDQVLRNRQMGMRHDEDIMSLRKWQKLKTKTVSPGLNFSIMCHNVLAQDLLENHLYLYQWHDPNSLKWERRWPNLLREMKKLMPDILCLQEVQETHIEKYFSMLQKLGYEGLFKKRTGNQSDGCAIYYKSGHFNLKEHSLIEYFKPDVSLLNRDNIGIVAKFESKQFPDVEFVVATTHLLYNPKRNDVRIAQIQLLLTEIEKISYKGQQQGKSMYLPIILTGDFNSPPESDLYRFVTEGALTYEQLSPQFLAADPENLNGRVLTTSTLGITDKCQYANILSQRLNAMSVSEKSNVAADIARKQALERNGVLSHNFRFNSVYKHRSVGNIKEGTTFQDEWLTVDYIFYSETDRSNKLKLLTKYELPTVNELNNIRIPNRTSGSDHLSLVAKFRLEC